MMRERKRYVIIYLKDEIDEETFRKDLIDETINFVGVKGLSFFLPRIVFRKDNIFVIRTTVEGLKIFRSILVLKGGVKGRSVRIIKVTGSLKKAKAVSESLNPSMFSK
ncbi:MAG: hypothetical protein DRJ64_01225 [Thermoprotei archaeon]|nr:MAG: hypothetical protein DRJ64_01225 [Thermoprotei archaeon]